MTTTWQNTNDAATVYDQTILALADSSAISSLATSVGSVLAAVEPNSSANATTAYTGSLTYELVPAYPGQRVSLRDLIISSDEDITWSIWTAATFAMIGDQLIKAGIPFGFSPSTGVAFRTNASEAMVLHVDSTTAAVNVTISITAA